MALRTHSMMALMTLAALVSTPVWASENPPQIHQLGNISYVTGGIGEVETDALRATKENYNLRITNADKVGHFSGDTRVVISDLTHNILLDVTSGPLFYANLPNGKYVITGFSGEESKKEKITIVSGKATRVRFMWLADATDSTNQ